MKQSFLINDRIYLRAVEPEDMDVMYEMENDPSMWDISNFTVPYSRYVLRQYIEGSQCDVFADKQLRLMIVRKSDHCILGTIDIIRGGRWELLFIRIIVSKDMRAMH